MGGTIAQIGQGILRVDNMGYISRDGQEPSGEWQVLGAQRFNNFGKPVEYIDFYNLYRINGQWRHQNGKQKFHLVDLDHGSRRVWQSPNHVAYFEELPLFKS